MNQLGIVTRACLREAEEETRGQRAKRYAKIAGAGALAAGLPAYAAYAATRPYQMRPGRTLMGVPAAKARMQSAYDSISGAAGDVFNRAQKRGAMFVNNHSTALKRAGVVGLGGAAAYGGYKLYKHLQAKRAAAQAAKEAYYTTYQTLMEAEDGSEEPSTLRKWGKRAAVVAGTGAHRGLLSKGMKNNALGSNYRKLVNAVGERYGKAKNALGAGYDAASAAYK